MSLPMRERRRRKKRVKEASKSYTLPPSPSSSSSDFEFTISISPRKSSNLLCPADELFYKGQLLPLQLSPRISMVRTLLLSSSTSSTTSSAARDSTGSTSSSNDSSHSSFASDLALFPDCDSSRPSSVTNDDDFKRLNDNNGFPLNTNVKKRFSFSRLSSVFRKDNPKTHHPESVSVSASSVKRMSNTAKEVFRKYLKKVKPLYEMLSQKQQQQQQSQQRTVSLTKTERSAKETDVSGKVSGARKEMESVISHSFSGNLRYPLRRKSCVSSCPSSMRSSPTHSGVLSRGGFPGAGGRVTGGMCYGDASTMEELQSAIQGAIAHCKNSLNPNKTTVSNEI